MNKYDEAIEYLTKNPHEIENAWRKPSDAPGGCLFQFLPPPPLEDNLAQGCLTMIRSQPEKYSSRVPFLDEIIQDERIPLRADDITIERLSIFKEYQERVEAWVAEQK